MPFSNLFTKNVVQDLTSVGIDWKRKKCQSGFGSKFIGGGSIQEYDIYSIRSMRRNPVIADLFHRMKYMERRGNGLHKIVSETEKLPGYSEIYKPEFFSTATDFRVILKNVNYNLEGDTHQVTNQDSELSTVSKQLLFFCTTPKSKKELAAFCGLSHSACFQL